MIWEIDEQKPTVEGRQLVRAMWRLIRPYWTSPDAKLSLSLLAISIALVVGAYAVMLALQAEPVTVDNRAVGDTAPAASSAAPAPAAETAKSPS